MRFHLHLAVRHLRAGGVVAYPTEAVWGLGCDPRNEAAVMRILRLKARPAAKGLILVAGDWSQFGCLLDDLEARQRRVLRASWPGPNTWLVPHRGRVPAWLSGRFDTIALRVSGHPPVVELCRAAGMPLVSTSANPAGCRPATAAFQVRRYFGNSLDCVVRGAVGGAAAPSTIRDLRSGELIRG